jgi:hypothetical protein
MVNRAELPNGHCDDIPPVVADINILFDNIWSGEIFDLAKSHPHRVISDTIYFRVGLTLFQTKLGFDGYLTEPVVINDPKISHLVMYTLDFSDIGPVDFAVC